MGNRFRVDIYTPYGQYLTTESDYLSCKTPLGVMGILPNHAPLISTLEISKLTIKLEGRELNYAISGGVINIKKDHSVTLLVQSIERSDEIDVERALAAKSRAEERLNNKDKDEIDVQKARASLLRALNRLDVSGKN